MGLFDHQQSVLLKMFSSMLALMHILEKKSVEWTERQDTVPETIDSGSMCITVKLSFKELFGHYKKVPYSQKFLISNILPKYHTRYT